MCGSETSDVRGKLGQLNETYEVLRPSDMIFSFCDSMPRKELSQRVTLKLSFKTTRKRCAFLSQYIQDCLARLKKNSRHDIAF